MRNFLDRMEAGRNAAAVRRHRGLATGQHESWDRKVSHYAAPELDAFDALVDRAQQRAIEAVESLAAALLRLRELDLGETGDEVPF